jgi:hypothetical protein
MTSNIYAVLSELTRFFYKLVRKWGERAGVMNDHLVCQLLAPASASGASAIVVGADPLDQGMENA